MLDYYKSSNVATYYLTSIWWNLKVRQTSAIPHDECRRGARLPFIGRWARRWINHYCLWRMVSATPDLQLLSWYSFCLPTNRWPDWVDLGAWLHTKIVYPPVGGHPSNTNRARRRATTLIETLRTLLLSQTANSRLGLRVTWENKTETCNQERRPVQRCHKTDM